MRFTHEQYAHALYESFQDTKPKDHEKIIANFIEVLKANGDLSEYERIIDAFEVYDRQQKGIHQVEVTTAQDIELNKPLLNQLNEIVGGNIELKRKIDEKLIGGVVIKVDDTLIDGSVKRQLEHLENTLKE